MHQGNATLSRGNDTTDAEAPAVKRQTRLFGVRNLGAMQRRKTASTGLTKGRRASKAARGVLIRWHGNSNGFRTAQRCINRLPLCQPVSVRHRFYVASQPFGGSVRVRRPGRLDRAATSRSLPGASMNKPSHVFHERFRMLRARAQLSQGQVAESLGVSQNAVGTWERGESQPQVEHLHDICELFRVSSEWLIGRCSNETGLPIGMFLVDMDAAEEAIELDDLAVQVPQRPALMTYEEVLKIYREGAKSVKRRRKR